METKKLETNKVYEITHVRKGKFVAILVDVVPADEGDEQDQVYLHVRYDVRTGTDQAHLKASPKQEYRESNLRPSLILKIEEYKNDHWLRKVVPPKPARKITVSAPQEGLLNKVKKGLFGGN